MTYSIAGAGPLLVCHPGGPGFDGLYFGDLGGLTAVRTVVRVNPAGTGCSDAWREAANSLERRADDVDDLRGTLGGQRIDYLGHSAGGFVGMRYAALYPQRVRRLVLVGTIPGFTDDVRAAIARQGRLHAHEPWFDQALDAHRRRVNRDYADDEFHGLYLSGFRFFFARYGGAEQG